MNHNEFGQFVLDNGKDILRFCRMTCNNKESGDELYQDTMLKLLEKISRLDFQQNVKSYALSISVMLWKNKKRKYANRKRLIPTDSIERMEENDNPVITESPVLTPENIFLHEEEKKTVQGIVALLPEKYRIPIHLYYSSDIPVREIAKILHVPEGTVKSRMSKARRIIRKELEVLGYDK